mmetsp:Transcript_18345/g.25239  ORF Transcript_18345/g.25239 Transcript_18345/m.25239 type:complete len:515 (-) Transcript_18345:520-2064(-)|eukprot:CAMPEP_0185730642 /NCGR_PEP_ID=MMETSP1171-20130828/10554_1 /TAXON_ID=374046 /ORGANISM="Helicotheca tamensis, Strain CCMP826" /LENGTH=514 /DNA_ID=CAMNT_0028399737 /DNA_START=663 /DNA_END=2207 /DNA_ORIENTATION=+
MSSEYFLDPETISTAVALALAAFYLFIKSNRARNKINAKLSRCGQDVILPPHVQSYIPVLGSALEMGKGIRAFITKYGERFCAPVFTAKIGSDHCLFIADPDHVTMVYRYHKYLDDLALQKIFVRNVIGVTSPEDFEEMFHSDKNLAVPKLYHTHLFTDVELNKTIGGAQEIFQDLIPKMVNEQKAGEWCQHKLFDMVREYVFKASVAFLISKHLASDEASQLFKTFDKGIPLMFGGAPSFLTKNYSNARQTLVDMIYDPNFLNMGSDLMVARRALGFSENVYVRGSLGLLFASVGNSIPAVFWCIYHIVADPEAYQAIQGEIEDVLNSRSGGNDRDEPFTLEELSKMVLVKSAFTEALRLYQGAFTAREATTDFVFDPKKPGQPKYLIKEGTKVMAFVATMHHDPDVFTDPLKYQYDRFAPKMGSDGKMIPATFTKNGKQVTEPVRAFGGGSHLCPGRKFISCEAQAFIALLLSRFDLRLMSSESSPQIDYSSQGVGISHPDRDPTIEVRLRA